MVPSCFLKTWSLGSIWLKRAIWLFLKSHSRTGHLTIPLIGCRDSQTFWLMTQVPWLAIQPLVQALPSQAAVQINASVWISQLCRVTPCRWLPRRLSISMEQQSCLMDGQPQMITSSSTMAIHRVLLLGSLSLLSLPSSTTPARWAPLRATDFIPYLRKCLLTSTLDQVLSTLVQMGPCHQTLELFSTR